MTWIVRGGTAAVVLALIIADNAPTADTGNETASAGTETGASSSPTPVVDPVTGATTSPT